MKVLITGICGFVGSVLAQCLIESNDDVQIIGIDNMLRTGSETNRLKLRQTDVKFVHADLRAASDFEALPATDCVIDAAGNASVLAGVQQGFTTRQLFEHNLGGFINVLEYCKAHNASLLLLSSSRVYSMQGLNSLPMTICENAFELDVSGCLPPGASINGIASNFSTDPPVSLYGSMKL